LFDCGITSLKIRISANALVEQPGVLATLSRWRPWVQIPSGALKTRDGTEIQTARYANRQSDQAQTLVICGFDSRSCQSVM
jgi:hypothetical protein